MKKQIHIIIKKSLALVMIVLLILSSSVVAGTAITVEKDGKQYFLGSSSPTTGDCKVLIIRVGFADYPIDDESYPADSEEDLLSYFDGSSDSLTAYYKASSYGKLNFSCDKVYSYSSPNDRSAYESDIDNLIVEAINYIGDDVNLDDFDSNGDGILDFVCFDFSGPLGEWHSTWWPHVDSEAHIDIRDKKINSYSLLQADVSTYIHEFGHLLGAVDYYSYSNSHSDNIMTFDIMSNNTGDHDGFTKWTFGWIDDEDIEFVDKTSGDTIVNLTPIEYGLGDGKKIAVISPQLDRSNGFLDEFFVVEYDSGKENNAKVFEDYSFESGFRIFHVNAKAIFNDDERAYFSFNNSAARLNLIHNMKNELYEAYEWGNTENFFKEGDSLTAFGYPNTGMNDNGIYNGRFTGISLTDFVTGDNPSFKVSFSDESVSQTQPKLSISYTDIKAYVKITVESDQPLSAVSSEYIQNAEALNPYLIDDDGNKYVLGVDNDDISANEYNLVYDESMYPYIRPNTEYTLVIPEGFFRTGYNLPVAEFRERIKSSDFISFITIGSFPATYDNTVMSNPFAVTGSTYGLITFDSSSNEKYKFTEYDKSGNTVSSFEFDPPIKNCEDEYFYQCSVEKLNDGNFAFLAFSNMGFRSVKIDPNGKVLSNVFDVSYDTFYKYTSTMSDLVFEPYKNGLGVMINTDDDMDPAFLYIDFQNEPKITEISSDTCYFPVDDNTYFVKESDGEATRLYVYDASDKLISEISTSETVYGVFGNNGNISMLYSHYNLPTKEIFVYCDTYSRDGALLEHKDVSGQSLFIDYFKPNSRIYSSGNGFCVESGKGNDKTIYVYEKDWTYRGRLRAEQFPSLSYVGDYAVLKRTLYVDALESMSTFIFRLDIGSFESEPEQGTTAPTQEETTPPAKEEVSKQGEKEIKSANEKGTSLPAADYAGAKSATYDSSVASSAATGGDTVQTGDSGFAIVVMVILIAFAGVAAYFFRCRNTD